MLSLLTHSGARFSSAYFMAPKVRVTAAKNGENCSDKAAQSVRIQSPKEDEQAQQQSF
jgi:hypothetical protein